jgi:predicted nucleic acid-binding protein
LLEPYAKIYLDANSVIAIVERSIPFSSGQIALLGGIDSGAIMCVSSELTLAECLVQPLRDKDLAKARDFADFLDDRPELPLVPFTRAVFLAAAELRAITRMKLPDALHVACATTAGCNLFLSADTGIRLPASLRRVAFEDL